MSALLEQLNEGMGDVVERAGQSLVRVSAGGRGFGAGRETMIPRYHRS